MHQSSIRVHFDLQSVAWVHSTNAIAGGFWHSQAAGAGGGACHTGCRQPPASYANYGSDKSGLPPAAAGMLYIVRKLGQLYIVQKLRHPNIGSCRCRFSRGTLRSESLLPCCMTWTITSGIAISLLPAMDCLHQVRFAMMLMQYIFSGFAFELQTKPLPQRIQYLQSSRRPATPPATGAQIACSGKPCIAGLRL